MQHGNVHGEEVYQGNVAQGGRYHGEGYIDNEFSDSINYSDVNLASVNQGSAYHGQTYRGERYLGEVYQRGVADGEEADDEGSEVDSDVAEVDDSWRNRVPGPFLYNRRVILISLPCFVLMVALTGELLLCIVGIGLTMVSVLHTYGEHDRSLVVFMVTFLMAQITVIYTVVPLLWVSLVNLVLIGLINGYAVMTGCWLVVQLPAFRQQARDTLQFVEKALFSLYPGFCVSLWTWTLCFVFIPAKVAPFLLLVFSFVVLQVFLVPAESSFPPGPPSRGEDSQVLDPVLYGLVVSAFCVSPALLHCAVSVFHYTDSSFIQPVIRLCFLLCASVFLTTLLGLRKFIEHIGWSYSVVIKARWVSGLTLAVTTSPVLMGLGASSPLLHWVPVVVAAYICYGIFLSHKQYRMFSSLCAAALILLHIFHVGWLPWKLEYYVPVIGLHISAVHILIVLNAVLCLLCVYVASYGAPEVLGTVISVQTVVFLCSEVLLLLLDLYSPTLTVCTGAVGSYIFIRLYQVKKLPWKPAWFCTSCHMSGIVISFISAINSHLIGSLLAASLSIFPLVSFLLYVLLFEERSNISKEQAYVYIVLAYGVCGLGVHAVGGALWEVTLAVQPCTTDIIGVWVWTSGLLVTFLSQLLFPTLVVTHYWGAFSVLQGAIIIFLLPETSSSWLMLQYWGLVLTVPVFYAMLFCGQITDIKQILAMAFVLVAFPSTVLVTEVYNEEALLFLYVLWILSGIFLASIFLIILKSGFSVVKTERYLLLLYFCELTVTALALLHALVCYGLDWSKRASISLLISTLGLLTLSLAGKLSSFRYRNMPQRLIEEHKLRAGLPLLGNIVCVSSFLMLCVISPYSGFAYDLWLVLSSASFLCLQWDNLLLTKFGSRNQTAPMVVISLIIMMLSAIYNSAFWDLSLSLATVRGFFELLIITVTFPGYMLFTAFLWTGKVLLSEKFIVFVAPLNLALLLLSSSSASIMLGSSGLVISTWLMSFIFTLEKDHPAKR